MPNKSGREQRARMNRRVRTRIGTKRDDVPLSRGQRVRRVIWRIFLVLISLVLLTAFAIWSVCAAAFWGPSPAVKSKAVTSLMEMSVGCIIPPLFLPKEEIDRIVAENQLSIDQSETDPELIRIRGNADPPAPGDNSPSPDQDEWAGCEDGIRIEDIRGDTYRGYVMLIRDPSRVYVATASDFQSDEPGLKIDAAVEKEGAVAAINGGAFPDDGTASAGYEPLGLTYSKGERVWGDEDELHLGVVGFDENDVLIVGNMTGKRAAELRIRDCVSFGPLLVVNGKPATMTGDGGSLNPRTAIGQRADGTVIFLCIDGRMPQSLGASYADLVAVMVRYGAVNACNLDGGSSTGMIYQGKRINVSSSLYGPRRMPTFFMVRPQS